MKKILHIINGGIKRTILVLYPMAFPQTPEFTPDDPERKALYRYCKGLGIDVGCGGRKTHPRAIGIDLVGKGEVGKYGSQRRQYSAADIVTSGDNLYMFADGVLDYVVARHNLEHYTDPVKALQEWKRVLRRGGVLGVVLPDDDEYDTILADPTHKHVFTQGSYVRLLRTIGGFKITRCAPCVKGLSFYCIAKRI